MTNNTHLVELFGSSGMGVIRFSEDRADFHERVEDYVHLSWGEEYSLGITYGSDLSPANVTEVVDSTGVVVGYVVVAEDTEQ